MRPRLCANHPRCRAMAETQAWCAACWEHIDPDLQQRLLDTYRQGQEFDGDCAAWMTAALAARPLEF